MPFVLMSQHERLEFSYEGATIYYHRLSIEERAQVSQMTTERGQIPSGHMLWLATCQLAVDAWEEVYGADGQLVPTPPVGARQREQIAHIVQSFPVNARQELAAEALADSPEAIKKRWGDTLSSDADSSINALGMNTLATTADASGPTTTFQSHAIPEG